jgi:3-hydroxybutyryl-CoA dehydratase
MPSLYFEDFTIGAEWGTRSRTITEADIVQFAALTGDFTYLHTDAERAAGSPFGERIAHGALIFSYSIGLITQLNLTEESVLAFYGLDRLRFVRPVKIGDTITVERKVTEIRPKPPGRGVVTFETAVLNQRGETVVAYADKVLLRTRA